MTRMTGCPRRLRRDFFPPPPSKTKSGAGRGVRAAGFSVWTAAIREGSGVGGGVLVGADFLEVAAKEWVPTAKKSRARVIRRMERLGMVGKPPAASRPQLGGCRRKLRGCRKSVLIPS